LYRRGVKHSTLKNDGEGKECKEVTELLFRTSETPRGLRDSMLIYGSIMKAQEDVCGLVDKYGLDTVKNCCEKMIRAGEEAMRREIEKSRTGSIRGKRRSIGMDDTQQTRLVRVKLTVNGMK